VPRVDISHNCTADTEGKEQIFIWGDSHAQHYSYGLKEIIGDAFSIRQIASSSCKPAIVAESSDTDYCVKSNFEALEYIARTKPSVVLLGQVNGHDVSTYDELVNIIKNYGVSTILLMGPTPQWDIVLPEILVRDLNYIPRKLMFHQQSEVISTNEQLKERFRADQRVIFVDVINEFCDESGCLVYLGNDVKEGITTWDYGHLTPVASEHIAKKIKYLLLNPQVSNP
jgi:hypothetical protein